MTNEATGIINLTEYLSHQANEELSALILSLSDAVITIDSAVRNNSFISATQSKNYNGDLVMMLDNFANEVIISTIQKTGHVCVMASEESADMIILPQDCKKGKYVLAFDPIDGSNNIDVNIIIGSIFSIYERLDNRSETNGDLHDLLQKGSKQIAAGYILYGNSTMLVFTIGQGTQIFTFDRDLREFKLSSANQIMPAEGYTYSTNEGNYFKWKSEIRDYIDYLKTQSENGHKPFKQRYTGTIVADIHRIIKHGGIYLYPDNTGNPNGKIRQLYEANPLAFIIEQCGGMAIDGKNRILDLEPTGIHGTLPFIAGSIKDIEEFRRFMEKTHPFQNNRR
jgi:fructose-1,6-bisphosphatase I